MIQLGKLYAEGDRGLVKNEKQALVFFKKAADAGGAEAMYRLGLCFGYGMGILQDTSETIILYWQASEKKHQLAKTKLTYLQGVASMQAWQLFDLANRFKEGDDSVPQDYREAAILYGNAAKKGNIPAMYELAVCYEMGLVHS